MDDATADLLTIRVLDYFEDQTNRRLVVTLEQFLSKLREFMRFDQRPMLPSKGSVSMAEAKQKASEEMKQYKARLRAERETEGEAALKALSGVATSIASAKKKKRKKNA